MTGDPNRLRLDKWLWFARFFKTRSLAAKQVASGAVRVNGVRVVKPAHSLRTGYTLTFPQGDNIRVVRVLALGTRRGSAPEAAELYEDLNPIQPAQKSEEDPAAVQPRYDRGGRPTKKDRRTLERYRS